MPDSQDIFGETLLDNKDSPIKNEIVENNILFVAMEIEKMTNSQEDVTYLDAIVEFCEKNNIEIEEAPKFLHKNILEKLKNQAIDLKLIEGHKKAKLPF
ncbi:MAG: hypothetical protein KAG14_04935 [Mycoplasmataceae bacterium]|nr:hypothetical protein [Mycoplasmataceae bacterium]